MYQQKNNLIVDKTFEFACDIVDVYKQLVNLKMYRIADQVCGAGTSIGANVREAQRAVSKADFINKRKIVEEELDESLFFIELLEVFNEPFKTEIKEFYTEGEILLKIIVASIISSR